MYSLIFFPSCFCRTITITCTKQLIACVSTWPKRKKKRRLSEQPHCHIIELSKMVFFPIPTSLDPGQTCEMTCLSLSLSSTLSLSFFSSLSLSVWLFTAGYWYCYNHCHHHPLPTHLLCCRCSCRWCDKLLCCQWWWWWCWGWGWHLRTFFWRQLSNCSSLVPLLMLNSFSNRFQRKKM